MIGLGTIINVAFVLVGTTVGLLVKKGIPERLQQTVISAVGLATCFIGISGVLSKMLYVQGGALQTRDTMLLVLSLVIGAFIGELCDIERRLNGFGEFCKRKIRLKNADDTFVEGFVSASLLFCVGAMAIVGSLEDGLNGNISTLFAKSVMDGTVAVFFCRFDGGRGVSFGPARPCVSGRDHPAGRGDSAVFKRDADQSGFDGRLGADFCNRRKYAVKK